ncbi:hypothetical protein SK128_023357 [Halocaridina rubra]|uniref:Uncharacterized protein n=1 Tax=Halocaridina rubra TaxID=373956 RepID=A0AAN8XL75_HALRR
MGGMFQVDDGNRGQVWSDESSLALELKRMNEEFDGNEFCVGGVVLVKSPGKLCSSCWTESKATELMSAKNVDVDGVLRHVLDIRHLFVDSDDYEDEYLNGSSRSVMTDLIIKLLELFWRSCRLIREMEWPFSEVVAPPNQMRLILLKGHMG